MENLSDRKEPTAGMLRLNATSIALRKLELADGIFVESTNYPPGQDPDRLTLRSFIDQRDHFIVLFEDFSLVYLLGSLFRDDGLPASEGDQSILRHIETRQSLAIAASEKGNFAPAQIHFDQNSVFGILVNDIAANDGTLVCDDLGNEWADFIGVDRHGNVPILSFYHAKHGDLSLGASPFHIAVSQALKNLGTSICLLPASMQKSLLGTQSTPTMGFRQTSPA